MYLKARKALGELGSARASLDILRLKLAVAVELAVLEQGQAVPATSLELETADSAGREYRAAAFGAAAASDRGVFGAGVERSVGPGCGESLGYWSVERLW